VLDAISWKLTLPFQPSQIVPTLAGCENRTVNEVTANESPKVWFEKLFENDTP